MNEDSHTSLLNIKNSREVSPKQAEPSGASSHYIPQDEQLSQHSTYGSFFWFYNFTKRFATRIANDMLMSFLRYWFPNTVPLPYHLVDLLRVHNNLRAERELHTVTYSRYSLIKHSCVITTANCSTQTISLVPENNAASSAQR